MTDNSETTTEFEVGDRVRVKSDRGYWAGVIGTVCGADINYIYFHQLDGERFKDGSVVWHEREGHGFRRDSLEYAPKPAKESVQGQTDQTVYDRAVVERMASLVAHAAKNASGYTQVEARAIQALLEPVSTDWLEIVVNDGQVELSRKGEALSYIRQTPAQIEQIITRLQRALEDPLLHPER